jgi:hypothetical protein
VFTPHSGGLPEYADKGKRYIRLHVYLPSELQKPPSQYTIQKENINGETYKKIFWHDPKPIIYSESLAEIDRELGRMKLVDVSGQIKAYFKQLREHARSIKIWKKLQNVDVNFCLIDDYLKNNSKILDEFITFFENIGMFEVGVLKEEILCSVFYNFSDNPQYQVPHTDYYYKVVDKQTKEKKAKGKKTKDWLAWSVIIPITKEGSWLTIWDAHAKPALVKINFGKALLFRSDVIHASCRPKCDKEKEVKFYRLHFDLQTEFQKAPKDEINILDLDGETELGSIVTSVSF